MEVQIPYGKGHFEGGRAGALLPTYAWVHAPTRDNCACWHMQWTNAFATARSDM